MLEVRSKILELRIEQLPPNPLPDRIGMKKGEQYKQPNA
jgi:hypothetical protein